MPRPPWCASASSSARSTAGDLRITEIADADVCNARTAMPFGIAVWESLAKCSAKTRHAYRLMML
jgi:hypothetical protein